MESRVVLFLLHLTKVTFKVREKSKNSSLELQRAEKTASVQTKGA
jgi:hypothetical protein